MEEEQQRVDGEELSSPLALSLGSSPLSLCKNSSTQVTKSSTICDRSSGDANLETLSCNLQNLISPPDNAYSDVLFYVRGRIVPLHRCILAVRCPFFKSLFAKNARYLAQLAPTSERRSSGDLLKLKIDLGKLFAKRPEAGKVTYEAFMTVVGFLYTGVQVVPAVKCVDRECPHDACKPVLDFAISMLGLTSVLEITGLRDFWKERLCIMLEKAQVDEVLPVLLAAKLLGEATLLSTSLHIVARSYVDDFDIEKQLPEELAKEVFAIRCNIGLLKPEDLNSTTLRECQRIRKAVESDDVELVQLLLKEGNVDLNQAYALHYAAAYCDAHTVKDIVDLGLADINLRNNCGFTALHVASIRQDPSILVTLLSNGANPLDTTPDGRTALQLCQRSMTSMSNRLKNRVANFLENNHLCMEILYQAETKGLFDCTNAIFPPTLDEKELFMRLVYFENRMTLARLLFPQEWKLVADISHLKCTSEFIGFGFSNVSKMSKNDGKVDLNQIPSIPVMNEALLKRLDTVQLGVTLGRRMFPYTAAAINRFTDDEEPLEQSIVQAEASEEQKRKKQRYDELKQALENALLKEIAAADRHKQTETSQVNLQH